MIVTPLPSLERLLDVLIGALSPWVHLYVVDITLTPLTVLADLTECTVPGYTPQKTTGWSAATIAGHVAVTYADPLVYTHGAGAGFQDVWGYYVTDGLSGPLLWCERGGAPPYALHVLGEGVLVQPRFTLGDCNSPQPPGILSAGDLVGDGSTRDAVTEEHSAGDLVGDGSSRAASTGERSAGDLVGDGSMSRPPLDLSQEDHHLLLQENGSAILLP